MRVLVTGASGYLGWATVHELRDAGHHVVALVHRTMRGFGPGVEVRRGDVLDENSLRNAVREVDGVCHLAALTRVRDAASQPTRYFRLNTGGTLNVVDALAVESERTGRPARMVFASTGSVYGAPERQPISEDAPTESINPYASSKVAAEQLIGWQVAAGVLGAAILRIFNAAGAVAGYADPDESRILPKAVAVAAGRAPYVQVNGDGSAVRDFVHVADIAHALRLALEATETGHKALYNVGAVSASVRDVIAEVERVSGRTVPVVHRPAHAGEARLLAADTTRIRSELGWKPERSTLEQLATDQWTVAGLA